MRIYSVTVHPLGKPEHAEFDDLDATIAFVRTMLENGLDCQVMTTVETCIHPGMFSGDAPRYEFGHPEGGEFYAAWLNSTKRCDHCGADVKMRDL